MSRQTVRVQHAPLARALRAAPGTELAVNTYRSRYCAEDVARRIANGDRMPCYRPAGAYAARPEDTDFGTTVYVRYVGPPTAVEEQFRGHHGAAKRIGPVTADRDFMEAIPPAAGLRGGAPVAERSCGRPLFEVAEWVLVHLHEPLDAAALAARAGMHPRVFRHRFRLMTGHGPVEWIRIQRLRRARRLLETTNYSVSEIALRCGFGSIAGLRKQFSQHFGTSPHSYRRARRRRCSVGA